MRYDRLVSSLARDSGPRPATSPELSDLAKAPGIRSIRFKRTNPGTLSYLNFAPEGTPPIDPSHPLAHIRLQQLMRIVPGYHCPLFGIHAYPQAILRKFDLPEVIIGLKDRDISNELAELIARQKPHHNVGRRSGKKLKPVTVGDQRRAAHTLPMSLMIVASKPLHKSGIIRSKIKLRIKEALSLVAIRGARLHDETARKGIMLSTPKGLHRADIQTSLLLQGKR
ncbi:hypothetical protein JB92DRAFT_2912196 [Gautieria morchelliformis]|nr:hypothetical protein JB92DRAFT_2912196 [Gautieria morchelliformis]